MKRAFYYTVFFALGFIAILGIFSEPDTVEKPRDFDPFGQAGLSPLATI